MSIQFIDLQAQRKRMGKGLEGAIQQAVVEGNWIMGPQVRHLENKLAEFAHVKHTITCANGTDALMLVLHAWGIGPGDAVIVPTFTFAASAEVIALLGATPIFVDVLEDTFNIDPASLKAAVVMARRDSSLKLKAVMPVDLFGQTADYRQIAPIVANENLLMLCDAAQAFGAKLDDAVAGGIGDAAGTSFFPAKPLGCYGDGGAVFTNDDDVDAVLRSLRVHGQGMDKYENVRIGVNSRLDTIQAAILIEKLKLFTDEIAQRNRIAARYSAAFATSAKIRTPYVIDGAISTWAQYTIRVSNRGAFQADLKAKGIPSMVYYRTPLTAQKAYAHYPSVPVPVSQRICQEVVSLPMHPYLAEGEQDAIIEAVLVAAG